MAHKPLPWTVEVGAVTVVFNAVRPAHPVEEYGALLGALLQLPTSHGVLASVG